jgi:5'-3' exonuclease
LKRLLIIDAQNMFVRNWVLSPAMDTNGNPIGGVAGFLKSLQKEIREMKPDRVVICWEGGGGSMRRRSLNKDYKAGRKAPRLNRAFQLPTAEGEKENKLRQQLRLIEYLDQMVVTQLSLENQEADDIIGWLCSCREFNDWAKIIVSSDKDFIQLCDDKTVLVRPVAKEILNKGRVIEKFSVHPRNFALARSLVGDTSDNIKGVKGVGMKTVVNRFPFLIEDRDYTVEDLIDYAEINRGSAKVYEKVAESQSLLRENFDMMQLYITNIPPQGIKKVEWILDNTGKTLNKHDLRVMMRQDGILNVNIEKMMVTMSGWSVSE